MLGPPDLGGAVNYGIALAKRGISRTLLMSSPTTLYDRGLCNHGVPGIELRCFDPVPSTTAGEASYVASAARRSGWSTLVVVTGLYHVSRARAVFRRCLNATVDVVGVNHGVTATEWAKQYLYETGAWAKMIVDRPC